MSLTTKLVLAFLLATLVPLGVIIWMQAPLNSRDNGYQVYTRSQGHKLMAATPACGLTVPIRQATGGSSASLLTRPS